MNVEEQDVGKEWQEYLEGQTHKARGDYRDTLITAGSTRQEANRMAGIQEPERTV
jgi:hypothetical protein